MAAKKKKNEKIERVEGELVFAAGIERDDEHWLYLITRKGNIERMQRGVARARSEVLVERAIKREKGWMYFLDDKGDVVRAPDNSRG